VRKRTGHVSYATGLSYAAVLVQEATPHPDAQHLEEGGSAPRQTNSTPVRVAQQPSVEACIRGVHVAARLRAPA